MQGWGTVRFGIFFGVNIQKVYHTLLFDFSIPRIDRIRLRSEISRGDTPVRSSHFVKSISLTSCSTGIFVQDSGLRLSNCSASYGMQKGSQNWGEGGESGRSHRYLMGLRNKASAVRLPHSNNRVYH